ncbi:MAG: hypothetical protein AB4372_04690 [Xenococcus sp. (in: cyanobacteria)]
MLVRENSENIAIEIANLEQKIDFLKEQLETKKNQAAQKAAKKQIKLWENKLNQLYGFNNLAIGDWVCNGQPDLPGQIVELKQVNQRYEAWVIWDNQTLPEYTPPGNLTKQNPDLFIWDWDNDEKAIIREFDKKPCDDFKTLLAFIETFQSSIKKAHDQPTKISISKKLGIIHKQWNDLVKDKFRIDDLVRYKNQNATVIEYQYGGALLYLQIRFDYDEYLLVSPENLKLLSLTEQILNVEPLTQAYKTNPKTLGQLQTLLEKEIEEAKTELLQLKKSKQYNQQIVNEIEAQNEIIQQHNYVLDEIKSCSGLKIGQWVKRNSPQNKQPGQIVDIKIRGGKPVVEIQWWQDSDIKLESPKNLQPLTEKDLTYHWDGSKFPKFVRNIDGFECEDLQLLQEQLAELEQELEPETDGVKPIPDEYQRQIVYLKKRVYFLKQKNIENAELEEIEQLSLIPNHSDKQLQILNRFAQRKPETAILAIDQIIRDQRAQQREELDPEVVKEYSEKILAGEKLPPVKVKFDGTNYWLFDGFHTLKAAEQAGQTEIEAQITPGNLRDAILESVGVNADHGLRRTRETNRRSVMTLLRDPEWGQWSDREIARQCKVSQPFVSNLRKNLTDNVISDNHKNYKNKYGNISKMDTTNIGKKDPENAETDKLSHTPNNQPETQLITNNHQPPEKPQPNTSVPELETNQLVELNFTSFDGVSENLKLLNHHYGIITSKVEVGNGYNVKFFDCKDKPTASYVLKTEDLKPVQQVSLTVTFEPKEYLALMNIYGNRRELFDAIKQSLTGAKPK